MEQIPSKWLEAAVNELATLPGIGKKTAMHLALHLLDQDEHKVMQFSKAISDMKLLTKKCTTCCNISDETECGICTDTKRDHSLICVVEDVRDVIAIENTHQYRGVYHVLGGKISPMDGVGPSSNRAAGCLLTHFQGWRTPQLDVSNLICGSAVLRDM